VAAKLTAQRVAQMLVEAEQAVGRGEYGSVDVALLEMFEPEIEDAMQRVGLPSDDPPASIWDDLQTYHAP